jgi:hypothetical protein
MLASLTLFQINFARDSPRVNFHYEFVLSKRFPHDMPLRSGRSAADLINEGGDVTKRCGIRAMGGAFINI